ncbi:uncharacterized protein LOC114688097 isoform X2 [Peromyscus leucopus]|uniref:uncharacterized protein LOC114688097 isoform X2 n=1 Tax=Peromyscus leucopus TaxID=10041 RepID=UPI0018849396|nr:uncharacterized protein LOC114688097 isoform X2 [Peromyscus leucopus]
MDGASTEEEDCAFTSISLTDDAVVRCVHYEEVLLVVTLGDVPRLLYDVWRAATSPLELSASPPDVMRSSEILGGNSLNSEVKRHYDHRVLSSYGKHISLSTQKSEDPTADYPASQSLGTCI